MATPEALQAIQWPWSASTASPGEKMCLKSFPDDWTIKQGERHIQAYAQFLDGLGLRNIDTRAVINAHSKKRGSVWNQLPDRSLWKNIAGALAVCDRVSRELNVPVTSILSAYRHPTYNARCSGARPNSWHIRNYALDIKMGARPSVVATMVRRYRDKGHFRGGIGRYRTFTHIDTRGENTDW